MKRLAVCYLDMDEVLVDFIGGALRLHNKDLPRKDIPWGIAEACGFVGDQVSKFWAPMGYEFWKNLEWTSEGRSFLEKLEKIFDDRIVLMTSPCETEGCADGKIAWIKQHLPRYRRRFFIGPPKHLSASPTKILIDDHEGHIDNFYNEAGQVVLVPRPWNRDRHLTDENGNFDVDQVIARVEVLL